MPSMVSHINSGVEMFQLLQLSLQHMSPHEDIIDIESKSGECEEGSASHVDGVEAYNTPGPMKTS